MSTRVIDCQELVDTAQTIQEATRRAIARAHAVGCHGQFRWHHTEVTVAGDSDLGLIVHNVAALGSSSNTVGLKTVKPYPQVFSFQENKAKLYQPRARLDRPEHLRNVFNFVWAYQPKVQGFARRYRKGGVELKSWFIFADEWHCHDESTGEIFVKDDTEFRKNWIVP